MSFFPRVGPVAIGSRARLVSERLLADARQINTLYGSNLKAKWFPIFYLLNLDGPSAVSELAESIGLSHPAVVRMVNELVRQKLVRRTTDPDDRRRSLISLTEAGQRAGAILAQLTVPDVAEAVDEIAAECEHDLWAALAEWEAALQRRSLLHRTLAIRKKKASFDLKIVPYASHHQQAWHDLNEEWISQYFTMEPADYRSLDNPQEYILDKGGKILIAEYHDKAVGTCALIPMEHPLYDYELGKMSVSPTVQGLGFGYEIGKATLELARKLGAKRVYLESSVDLLPALQLYRKLGFVDVPSVGTDNYARASVFMAVSL